MLIAMEAKAILTATIILASTNAMSKPVHIVNVIRLKTIEFVLFRKYGDISDIEQKHQVKKETPTSHKSLE
jgi:hypothetical protein